MIKKSRAAALALAMCFIFTGCSNTEKAIKTSSNQPENGANIIVLDGQKATINGKNIEEFSYTWHTSPSAESDWYEGEEPQTDAAAYIAHDIWYYPVLNEDGFSIENYDGENEWVYRYTSEDLSEYIYATLPVQGAGVPVEMMHTAEDAYNNPVLHITQPGTYVLQGEWDGQIFIDLGDKDETFTDENAKVKIILDGVSVNCTVAPAFIAYSAYECDNTWEDRKAYSKDIDTQGAGVVIEIADNSVNNFTGTNIYRMLKPKYKKEGSAVQKKLLKIDGAFYSYVSMNIESQERESGTLNITSGFEGLNSELHLTINGGQINIYAQNDGINVNEDNVSVFTMNDGTLHIFAGLGAEGDGIDSNGYIVVNGGLIAGGTPSGADSLLDSDRGNTINGGEVITIGSSNRNGGFSGGMGRPDDGMRPDNFGFDKMPEEFGAGFGDKNHIGRPMGQPSVN